MIITFDNKEDYAIWQKRLQQMVERQLSNTKSALKMAKFGGTYKDDNANGGNTMANAKE